MIVRNNTPFQQLLFLSEDVARREFWTFVLRGTFELVPHARARLASNQEPIVEKDTFYDPDRPSSLMMESDLAPFKPRTDVFVQATAHALGGQARTSWTVAFHIGSLSKHLRITGPRAWLREGDSYRLTEPEPISKLPIRYEYAYGGNFTTSEGQHSTYDRNPIGVGYCCGRDTPDTVQAPQIEDPAHPIKQPGQGYSPEGLGPITRSWQPRLALAGTFDDQWRQQRWPSLPLDFEYSFFNAAHESLQAAQYLTGDEQIRCEGLHPEEDLHFGLPGYRAGLLLRMTTGNMKLAQLQLDTISLDLENNKAALTWRAILPATDQYRVIEARMTSKQPSTPTPN